MRNRDSKGWLIFLTTFLAINMYMWYTKGQSINAFCTGIFLMATLHWIERFGEMRSVDD